MIALIIVVLGFLVFREVQNYVERKRLTELLAAKNLADYRSEPAKSSHKRTNPLLERAKLQRTTTGKNYGSTDNV
jgi:hypothetical protein